MISQDFSSGCELLEQQLSSVQTRGRVDRFEFPGVLTPVSFTGVPQRVPHQTNNTQLDIGLHLTSRDRFG